MILTQFFYLFSRCWWYRQWTQKAKSFTGAHHRHRRRRRRRRKNSTDWRRSATPATSCQSRNRQRSLPCSPTWNWIKPPTLSSIRAPPTKPTPPNCPPTTPTVPWSIGSIGEETGTDSPNQWRTLWAICPEIHRHHRRHRRPPYPYVRFIKISRQNIDNICASFLYSSTKPIGSLFLFPSSMILTISNLFKCSLIQLHRHCYYNLAICI